MTDHAFEWRKHPALRERLHPDYPDDLQVIIHDGGPRISDRKPELVWVSVTASRGEIFTGKVLNRPTQLRSVSQGSEILFIVPKHAQQPILVTEKYLEERHDWIIHPCEKCGLAELFSAPSELSRATFPDVPDEFLIKTFTTFCGFCGGIQLVQHKDAVLD